MRTPGEAPHGVFVAAELEHGARGIAEVPGADDFVDAGGGEDVGAVLVPVVGQHLAGGGGGDGDEGCRLRRGGTEVEEAEGAVGGDGGEEVWRVGGEERRVGAGGCGEGLERALGLRGPLWTVALVWWAGRRGGEAEKKGGAHNLDGSVPGGRTESGLVDEVPVHRKHLARVLLPRGDRQVGEGGVKQLDGAVARGHGELILVQLREGDVVERVLRVKPALPLSACPCVSRPPEPKNPPFLSHDPGRGQRQDVQSAITDEPEIRRGGAGYAGVVEGRVFDGVAVVAFGAVVEHLRDGCRRRVRGGLRRGRRW